MRPTRRVRAPTRGVHGSFSPGYSPPPLMVRGRSPVDHSMTGRPGQGDDAQKRGGRLAVRICCVDGGGLVGQASAACESGSPRADARRRRSCMATRQPVPRRRYPPGDRAAPPDSGQVRDEQGDRLRGRTSAGGEASAIAALSQVSERTRQRVDEEVMRDWPGVEGAGS
jgi:hypothetical protein